MGSSALIEECDRLRRRVAGRAAEAKGPDERVAIAEAVTGLVEAQVALMRLHALLARPATSYDGAS